MAALPKTQKKRTSYFSKSFRKRLLKRWRRDTTKETLERQDDGRKFSHHENYLFLTKLSKSANKRGKQELFYRHGEKRKGFSWTIDGRLWHEQRWKKGKIVLTKEYRPDGIVVTARENKVVYERSGRVVMKELQTGKIRKFARYDEEGNVKELFCMRGKCQAGDVEANAEEFVW
ncbi:hypothetical protein A9K97_gp083 [Tokyovirus A1]|uniref:hypothetical protein n=1 Tax=Tokyovirus A1 TaxID=1826170 RepID=UPI0007A96C42|nr:hypothetical protein A9K97_gp083 [Tokyovirus A1]BAU80268.1 hypothetical protein [Tokyovirus A1]